MTASSVLPVRILAVGPAANQRLRPGAPYPFEQLARALMGAKLVPSLRATRGRITKGLRGEVPQGLELSALAESETAN